MEEKYDLEFLYTDPGYCRVMYKYKRTLIALMDDGYGGEPDFKLFVCSSDEEPIQEIDHEKFNIPLLKNPSNQFEREVNEGINNLKKRSLENG